MDSTQCGPGGGMQSLGGEYRGDRQGEGQGARERGWKAEHRTTSVLRGLPGKSGVVTSLQLAGRGPRERQRPARCALAGLLWGTRNEKAYCTSTTRSSRTTTMRELKARYLASSGLSRSRAKYSSSKAWTLWIRFSISGR